MRDLKNMAALRKPNLVLFLPDQQRADTIACYGGAKVHAPNLNKLASESVVFQRAYVTHPVCTPSRSSLMTGTWPHINGCTRNSVPLDRRFRVSIELSRPKFLERHACEFIEKHRGDPFILVVGFVEPHSPYNGPLNDEHPFDDVDLDVTATLPESEDIPLRYRLMREWQQAEAILDRQRLPTQLFFGVTSEEYRSIKQRYLGLVTLVDQSVGAILGCLERLDLSDHTIVAHTSDHGDSLGAHHLFGKETMFEEATRVPLLIRLPGQTRAKTIQQRTSHIDFVPTLLDVLGQANHPQCAGKSLVPLINEEAAAPENVFLEWAPNRTKVRKGTKLARRRMVKRAIEESTRAIVTPDGWKLCLRDKDLNELYNLNDDPLETRNLYADRQHASVIARLTGEIHRWQESANDKLKV